MHESRLDESRSTVIREELLPVWQGHEQQPGCDVIQPVAGPCLSSWRLEYADDYWEDYVEMLMTTTYNKLYCGFLSALFVSRLLEGKDPMIRSNTCKNRFQNAVLTQNVIFSCSSQSRPSNLHTSLKIRRRQSEQQSHENFVGIENNTEVNDDVFEENNLTVYVKTINRKTISISYYDNMKADVMLEEVERRTTIPRDMTRLIHKGKAINGKKSMKDNNIKANETIEMSLRLLGGMEVNEQMDTHETEEDREKKRKLDEGKEGKATKPSDDMAHLRKDIMEALKKSDEKWNVTPERMKKNERLLKKGRRLAGEIHDNHKHSWDPDPRYELFHCETS